MAMAQANTTDMCFIQCKSDPELYVHLNLITASLLSNRIFHNGVMKYSNFYTQVYYIDKGLLGAAGWQDEASCEGFLKLAGKLDISIIVKHPIRLNRARKTKNIIMTSP